MYKIVSTNHDKKLSKFKDFIRVPKRINGFTETFALYMVLCKNRNKLKRFNCHYEVSPCTASNKYKNAFRFNR